MGRSVFKWRVAHGSDPQSVATLGKPPVEHSAKNETNVFVMRKNGVRGGLLSEMHDVTCS